jgi:hypothetical protein
MFRIGKTICFNTNKYTRFCHHHPKRVFEPLVKQCNCDERLKKNDENIEANKQQITRLEGQIVDVKNNMSFLYLVNLYIVPILVLLK